MKSTVLPQAEFPSEAALLSFNALFLLKKFLRRN